MTQNEGEPTKFIRELKDKSSLLIFYEDQDYARSLGFLFLDNGIKNDHASLYLSCEPIQDTEERMAAAGIDVASSKIDGSLKIYNITNQKRDQITKTIEEFAKNTKKHLRITIQHDRFTRAQQYDLLLIEEFIQKIFESHDVSILSIYNTEFMDDAKFMQQVISIHEYTIFAPGFGKGIVIKTR